MCSDWKTSLFGVQTLEGSSDPSHLLLDLEEQITISMANQTDLIEN